MGKQIYDKSGRELIRDMVVEMKLKKGDTINKKQVITWFTEHYPKIKTSTISANLIMMSTNAPSRIHYNPHPGDDDLFFQIDGYHFRLYDPAIDPPPIQKTDDDGEKPKGDLANDVNKLINKYITHMELSIAGLNREIDELRKENAQLWSELTKDKKVTDVIVDEALRKRVTLLGSTPPLDTLIREAGVILENRIKTVSDADTTSVGVGLVDEVFNAKSGALIFSTHPGEQEGVRMLFRGAIQFIRNPPMHNLIDYSENTARTLLSLIDSLLQLLNEFQAQAHGDARLEDIHRMLKRSPIQPGQKQLYKVLYAAGESGLTNIELASALNRTRKQLTGVLGALGNRINHTKGLEHKGGISLVFVITTTDDGVWHYIMRPILRKALEEEGLV